MQKGTWQPGTYFEYDYSRTQKGGEDWSSQEQPQERYGYGEPQFKEEGFYGKAGEEDFPKRKGRVDWGKDVDWRGRPLGFPEKRAERPRGVSWQAPSKAKQQGGAGEGMTFKPAGEVDLNDPQWKEKLEEPTNTWKNYGKRGIDLPYYEGWWRPRTDIFEEEGDNLRVEFELPGIPVDNVSLSVSDCMIIITAVKPQAAKEERGFYYQNERHFGNFYRKLELPTKVDTTKVHANYDNGILKVTLPQTESGLLKTKAKIKISHAKDIQKDYEKMPEQGKEQPAQSLEKQKFEQKKTAESKPQSKRIEISS